MEVRVRGGKFESGLRVNLLALQPSLLQDM